MRKEAEQEIHIKILEIRDIIRKEEKDHRLKDFEIEIQIKDRGMDGSTKFTIDAEGEELKKSIMGFEDEEYWEEKRWI